MPTDTPDGDVSIPADDVPPAVESEPVRNRAGWRLVVGVVLLVAAIVVYSLDAGGVFHVAAIWIYLGLVVACIFVIMFLYVNRPPGRFPFVALLRFLGGASALVAAAVLRDNHLPTSLVLSVVILSALILVHLLLAFMWTNGGRGGGGPPVDQPAIFREAAQVVITTAGIVLALITFGDRAALTVTAKVGASSLGVGVLLAVVLYGLVSYSIPPGWQQPAASSLFNVAFWALAFGLICIVGSLW